MAMGPMQSVSDAQVGCMTILQTLCYKVLGQPFTESLGCEIPIFASEKAEPFMSHFLIHCKF